MRRLTSLTVFVFFLSLIVVPMVMAQAKPTPAKEPAKPPAKAAAAGKEPIKIGAIYDFAGPCYMYSESAIHGIRIAMDEINGKGGILGRKLDLIVRDTEAKVDVGARETKDLILREKVNFLMGPCSSGVSLAMQVVHSEYKVMRVVGIANTEGMTVDKFTPYIFQVVPNTYMEATANTRYLMKKVLQPRSFAPSDRIMSLAAVKRQPLQKRSKGWCRMLKSSTRLGQSPVKRTSLLLLRRSWPKNPMRFMALFSVEI